MANQMIAAVDGARARFFMVGTRSTPNGEEKKKLDEIESLINPAHRTKDGDLFSESRPGSRKAHAGGPGHGVDDKREAHTDEYDRKFAQLVMDKLTELIRDNDVSNVILASGPRMLGHLRDRKANLAGCAVGELQKHLTELSPHDLCLRLESDDLI
jgi:protein required for attachment to host cells